MLKLIQTPTGWALDHKGTTEEATVLALFGTTILPLPLTAAVEQKDALKFARTTEAGAELGVSL